MTFKTQAEIYQALLDGKSIKSTSFPDPYSLRNGTLVNNRTGDSAYFPFYPLSTWLTYEEPVKTKTVTFYRGIFLTLDSWLTRTDWCMNKERISTCNGSKLLRIEERTEEVPV